MPITRSQYKKYQEQIKINNNHDNKNDIANNKLYLTIIIDQ